MHIKGNAVIQIDSDLYNITNCADLTGRNLQVGILSSNGNCVNLYRNQNCSGKDFIRYLPGRLDTLYNPFRHSWVDNELVTSSLHILSMGPCFNKCDPRNWDTLSLTNATVTLYDRVDFQGKTEIL